MPFIRGSPRTAGFSSITHAGRTRATVVAEYTVSETDPNVADIGENVLLVVPQPFDNHNGGMIEFGPDGALYVGMGDGGDGNDPGNRAQNPANPLGKMLRLDVERRDGATIWASGFRNPWRFSFDPLTGLLGQAMSDRARAKKSTS